MALGPITGGGGGSPALTLCSFSAGDAYSDFLRVYYLSEYPIRTPTDRQVVDTNTTIPAY